MFVTVMDGNSMTACDHRETKPSESSGPAIRPEMASSQASTKSSRKSRSGPQRLLFIDNTRTENVPQTVKSIAQKKNIRAQAARSSSNARLATIRKRTEGRGRPLRLPGDGVSPTHVSAEPQKPWPCNAVEQHRNVVARYRTREASAALNAHTLLGGPIPVAQAYVAILEQFLHRFKIGSPTERPWIELVLDKANSSPTPSLVSEALRANATALCANDLNEPAVQRHATKLYLSAITQLQSSLRSPNWHDPTVMYTSMILSFYECIQTSNPSAQQAHIIGVAHLIQQKGPHSFTCGLEHKAFRYFRINILMVSLAVRRPSFLAETAWRTIPFSGDCPPKTAFDLLIDILFEIPGVLATAEALRNVELGRCALLQKAFKLAYWVRSLIHSLERWKEAHIWTYPAICTAPNLKNVDLLALCELATGLLPYDAKLGEALNCYMAAHLILARIAQRLAESSFVVRSALRPPHSLRNLVAGIVLVSERHIGSNVADMISMVVTAFPLKVAQSTTELNEPTLLKIVQELLDQVNDHIVRRYNINYSVPRETRAYEV